MAGVEQVSQLDERGYRDDWQADGHRGTPCGVRHPLGQRTSVAAIDELVEELSASRARLTAKRAHAATS